MNEWFSTWRGTVEQGIWSQSHLGLIPNCHLLALWPSETLQPRWNCFISQSGVITSPWSCWQDSQKGTQAHSKCWKKHLFSLLPNPQSGFVGGGVAFYVGGGVILFPHKLSCKYITTQLSNSCTTNTFVMPYYYLLMGYEKGRRRECTKLVLRLLVGNQARGR